MTKQIVPSPSPLPEPLPYEEEAKMLSEAVGFFLHTLPHAVDEAAGHLEEAAVSNALYQRLSQLSDEELAGLGLARDDVPEVAAKVAGLFKGAPRA